MIGLNPLKYRISPIQFLILLYLKRKPMYGYEIIKTLEEQFGDVWKPKTGTIYPALRSLELRGFIKTELKDDREVYVLTDLGEKFLERADEIFMSNLMWADKYFETVSKSLLEDAKMCRLMEKVALKNFGFLFPFHWIHGKGLSRQAELRLLKYTREKLEKRLEMVNERIRQLKEVSEGDRSQESN